RSTGAWDVVYEGRISTCRPTQEKGISHGATATLISARPSPRHRSGPRRSQRTGAVRGSMGAPRSVQARPQPDHVRHPDSTRPREATGRPPATCARQRAQTKRTERSHYPSGVLRRLASGDDCRARRQAGVRRPLATARRGRSAPYRLRSSWRGTPRTKRPEQLADGPLTLQYSPSSRTSRRGRVVPRAVVSRCSNVKPKLLDYLVGNGLMLPGFADTAAFDATLVNLGFGPQLRPQQVRPRAARLVLCLRYLFGAVRRPSPRSLRGARALHTRRPSSLTANGMDRLLF